MVNKIAFFPVVDGRLSTKAMASLVGLAPSTGVPRIKRSQFSMAEAGADVKS